MIDVKTVPNVRRTTRFLGDDTYFEVHEMPERNQVQLVMSRTDSDPDDYTASLALTLTADQWRVLQQLDYIANEWPTPVLPMPKRE